MKESLLRAASIAFSVLVASFACASDPSDQTVKQDSKVIRFAERALPYFPGSSLKITEDKRTRTASGSYRLISIDRDCSNNFLKGTQLMVVDENTALVYLGPVGELPQQQVSVGLKTFVESYLPRVLAENMQLRAKVSWETDGLPTGALIPFTLLVESGYGNYRKPAAVSADGKLLILGSPMSLNEDPVAARRKTLLDHPGVIWDHGEGSAAVEIVEFSDFECPGCKSKWPVVKNVMEKHGAKVRHGMVSFPLTRIHPWAFRSASASWCVAQDDPSRLSDLKEVFYSLQGEMKLNLVGPTAGDFVAGNGLAEEEFASCFLSQPSIAAVLGQMGLGHLLGVTATPTYFINGWKVQVPQEEWLSEMVGRLAEGQEP